MDHGRQVPLNWPDVGVLSTQRTAPGDWRSRVESTLAGAWCRRCGREMRDLHGWAAVVRLRPLPVCDGPGFVAIRPKRSRGPYCSGTPTTTPRGAWYEPRRPNTKAYAPWAWRLLSNATVVDAARTRGRSAETSAGSRDRWSGRAIDGTAWAWLGVLGLDEIARTRGHRDFVVLVTAPRAGGGVAILALRADRQQETVAAFRRARPAHRRRTLARTGTDLSEGFVSAIAAEGPGAELVLDRFQVARAYRDGADTGRTQERTRLHRARPKAASAERTGARWPFRKRPAALERWAWERRERVCTGAPTIEAADNLREDLPARCARDDTTAGATCALRAWGQRVCASGRVECERFLGTLERWIDTLTTSCQGRQTRGCVEGFKHRVQGLKRRCDGIFNVGRRFQRLTLDLHGYQRFGHTSPRNIWWSTTAIPGEPSFLAMEKASRRQSIDTRGLLFISSIALVVYHMDHKG
jgi:transposase